MTQSVIVEGEQLIIESIPICMQQIDMLPSALAIQEEEILYVTSVSHLNEFLNNFQQWAN